MKTYLQEWAEQQAALWQTRMKSFSQAGDFANWQMAEREFKNYCSMAGIRPDDFRLPEKGADDET